MGYSVEPMVWDIGLKMEFMDCGHPSHSMRIQTSWVYESVGKSLENG